MWLRSCADMGLPLGPLVEYILCTLREGGVMELERLFQALVVGGGLLVGGCAAKNTSPSPVDATPPESAKEGRVDCEKVCDVPNQGRESVCPDETTGDQNCCWLMVAPHECCP